MAEEQYAGRGQAQSSWYAQPGKNLTFSILLNPSFIPPENQFVLNISVCLGINDVLRRIIGTGLKIKWPNDVYVGDEKLGGILIENILQGSTWKHAIIGIGLNINQENFHLDTKNVTSLRKILHQDYDLKHLLTELCSAISRRYLELYEDSDSTFEEYLSVLYRFNEEHLFNVSGVQKKGTIVGVDRSGRLQVCIDGVVSSFGFKEVSFVIP